MNVGVDITYWNWSRGMSKGPYLVRTLRIKEKTKNTTLKSSRERIHRSSYKGTILETNEVQPFYQSEGRVKLYLDRESEVLPPIFHMKNWFFKEIVQQNGRKYQFSSIAYHVHLLATPWTATHQVSLSITNSQSLLRLNTHRVDDVVQPSHPLSSPSSPAFNFSQHQGLSQWVSSLLQVAKVLEFQHQSFQWIFRTDFL